MEFSMRYSTALRENQLELEIDLSLTKRIWAIFEEFDEPYQVRISRYDSYTITRTARDAVRDRILERYDAIDENFPELDLEFFWKRDNAEKMDIIEFWCHQLSSSEAVEFQRKMNELFSSASFPWILADCRLFMIELDYIDAEITIPALEMMSAEKFVGALEEFVDARNDLSAANYKGAIHNSAKSFESVMKAILNTEEGNASNLLRSLSEIGFFDKLPPVSKGIAESVFMAVPFLRNRLAGHGQGNEILSVPENYARLTVELAAVFNRFFIQELALTLATEEAAISADELEIPF